MISISWTDNIIWSDTTATWSNDFSVIIENVFSTTFYGDPIDNASFIQTVYFDGVITTAITLDLSSINSITGAFTTSFVPNAFGTYQYSLKSNITDALYISDIYHVFPRPETINANVYAAI